MKTIYLMENIIRKYAWGSKTAIPELMGKQIKPKEPWAELWMGAHPEASSKIEYKNKQCTLYELIKKYSGDILGEKTADKYGETLPFLFKILAIERPLSIQAHPDKIHAEKGFSKENKLRIPLDSYYRNYKDKNHKPECVCALTYFHALNGFRKIPEILKLMDSICPRSLCNDLRVLRDNPDVAGLKNFFAGLLTMDKGQKQSAIKEAIKKARQYINLTDSGKIYEWMVKIHRYYPDDIGIFAPVLLNLIEIKPGQAMFIPPGQVHAYLEGMCIEIMANSDNVIRGGLTAKHIDVSEFIEIANFEGNDVSLIPQETLNSYEAIYRTPAEEFILSVIQINNIIYKCQNNKNVAILLCTEGNAIITDLNGKHAVSVQPGNSVIIPFCVRNYSITGKAKLYKASIPSSEK